MGAGRRGRKGAERGEEVRSRGWGGANRGLSGALLRPSQAGVREAFGEFSSGTCATIALQTSPPSPTDTRKSTECPAWEPVLQTLPMINPTPVILRCKPSA